MESASRLRSTAVLIAVSVAVTFSPRRVVVVVHSLSNLTDGIRLAALPLLALTLSDDPMWAVSRVLKFG
ncbi:MAG: hypothetical protein H0U21_12175 [Acidimicrobiia bacterium]|nr:hypothetical protein [Acidimicrobiia bacterium]